MRHRTTAEADNGTEILFTCDCGYRAVLHRPSVSMTVLDRGELEAEHSGSTGNLTLTMEVTQD